MNHHDQRYVHAKPAYADVFAKMKTRHLEFTVCCKVSECLPKQGGNWRECDKIVTQKTLLQPPLPVP